MATLYTSRLLLPINRAPIENGALLVDKGRILGVGSSERMMAGCPDAHVIDFGDAALLPPMVNAHTHLELTRFPGWAERAGMSGPPASFVDWIQRLISVKRGRPTDEFAPSIAAGISACLASGTAAIGDVLSYFPARSAYATAPLRGRIFYEALGREPAKCRWMLEAIDQMVEEGGAGWLSPAISPHSPYSLSDTFLQQSCNLARRQGLQIMIHLAESAEEVTFLKDSSGPIAEQLFPFVDWRGMLPPPANITPLEYLEHAGGLTASTVLVHGVQLTDAEIARIAEVGCSLVLCPRSNARLEVGKAPLQKLRDAGINLAFGTDSMASADSLSMWDEIAFAREGFGEAADPHFLLEAATRGGARALGIDGELGTFAPGYGIHFQVVRLPELDGIAPILDHLTSGVADEAVRLFLDGEEVHADSWDYSGHD
ncbi:MAG: metal-dependent hydrolase [Desulfuromonas sp.]|nr:MAG: metal-dependent hydrolase [Desulfuromonas sp.]